MSKYSRFTLVELLLVVASILILVMLLLPSLKRAAETARMVTCANNLKQIGVLTSAYADDHYGFLPVGLYAGAQTPWLPCVAANIWAGYVETPDARVLFCPDLWMKESGSCSAENWTPSAGWMGYAYMARSPDMSKVRGTKTGYRGWNRPALSAQAYWEFAFNQTSNPNKLLPGGTPIASDFLRFGMDASAGYSTRSAYQYLDGTHMRKRPAYKATGWSENFIGRNQLMADYHVEFKSGWENVVYVNWGCY